MRRSAVQRGIIQRGVNRTGKSRRQTESQRAWQERGGKDDRLHSRRRTGDGAAPCGHAEPARPAMVIRGRIETPPRTDPALPKGIEYESRNPALPRVSGVAGFRRVCYRRSGAEGRSRGFMPRLMGGPGCGGGERAATRRTAAGLGDRGRARWPGEAVKPCDGDPAVRRFLCPVSGTSTEQRRGVAHPVSGFSRGLATPRRSVFGPRASHAASLPQAPPWLYRRHPGRPAVEPRTVTPSRRSGAAPASAKKPAAGRMPLWRKQDARMRTIRGQ